MSPGPSVFPRNEFQLEGKQHITGEGGPSYVVRLPEPCKTAEEWVASLGESTRPT